MLNTNKARRVYKRFETIVCCFDGMLIGPRDSEATAVTPDSTVKVLDVKTTENGLLFEVFMPTTPKGRKGIKETWVKVNVPNDPR